MGIMAKLRTLLAVLVIAQFIGSGVAHALPGCSATMPVASALTTNNNTVTTDDNTGASVAGSTAPQDQADYCQYHYSNAPASNGTVKSGGGDSGDAYGKATAPTPDLALCATPPCVTSNGIRQDAGVTNILYNNFYPGMTINTTTTCRFVDNNNTVPGTGDLFVPQRSLTEYTNFIGNAPHLGVAYCTQASAIQYTATSTYPNGYMLWNNAETSSSWSSLPTSQRVVKGTVIPVPTTRVNLPPLPGIVAPAAPGYPVTLTYSRQDCVTNAAGEAICNTRAIVETQDIEVSMTPNPNSLCRNPQLNVGAFDCDGTWDGGSLNLSTYTIDGVAYPSGLADYDPPVLTCGNAGNEPPASPGPAITQACPSGTTGTQQCQTVISNTYSCSGGVATLTGRSAPAVVSCVGTCTPCVTTVLGSTCASSAEKLAQAYFYQFPALSIPEDWAATGGAYDMNGTAVNYLTSANQINGLQLYTNQVNVPLQPNNQGFPGLNQLTEWFGVCYDAGYAAPTTGSYTFVTAANNGITLTIDGTTIVDNEGSDSPTAPDPMLGATVTLTAGVHDVEIMAWQGWTGALGFQLWAMTPGQTVNPAWLGDITYDADSLVAPPSSDIMPLTGPPGGELNCPHNITASATCGAEWASATSFYQPMTDLCDVGAPSAVTPNNSGGTWNWTCTGIGGGSSIGCSVTATTCGSANGTSSSTMPISDLCSEYEVPSPVTGGLTINASGPPTNGSWNWVCTSGGGVNIPCSAVDLAPVIATPPSPGGGSGSGSGSGGGGGGGGGGYTPPPYVPPPAPPPPESY
jgi:hypothetical protein